jgi:hypothetical protein
MSLDKQKTISFVTALILTVLGLFLVVSLSSCDTAKQAIKHHEKAEKLGYVYKCDPVTITLRDTIKGKDGKDSIVEVLVKVPCPKAEPPKTRWEIRHMAKAERDSMKHVENVLKLQNKALKDSLAGVKQILQEQKKIVQSNNNAKKKIEKPFPWNWFFACVIVLSVLVTLGFYKFKR